MESFDLPPHCRRRSRSVLGVRRARHLWRERSAGYRRIGWPTFPYGIAIVTRVESGVVISFEHGGRGQRLRAPGHASVAQPTPMCFRQLSTVPSSPGPRCPSGAKPTGVYARLFQVVLFANRDAPAEKRGDYCRVVFVGGRRSPKAATWLMWFGPPDSPALGNARPRFCWPGWPEATSLRSNSSASIYVDGEGWGRSSLAFDCSSCY